MACGVLSGLGRRSEIPHGAPRLEVFIPRRRDGLELVGTSIGARILPVKSHD